MSEMHYIAKFAEKQLADAKEKGMCGEHLAALLNALYAEADALTPGGGFVVAHVAKEMDLLEELPEETIALRNAYLFTCVVGYSKYVHKVVAANVLSPALIESAVSEIRQVHAEPNCSFQFVGVTPLGMMSSEGLREEWVAM